MALLGRSIVAMALALGFAATTIALAWSGIVGPAGMPRDVVLRLNAAFNRTLTSLAFVERFGQIGDEAAGGSPDAFGEVIRVELAKWADVIKRTGAKVE